MLRGRVRVRLWLRLRLRRQVNFRLGLSARTLNPNSNSNQVLIKCWDSHGRDFAPHHQTLRAAARAEGASLGGSSGAGSGTVPATFSLHSGFEDPATPLDAPDRESIEVRVVAFFEDD